ncbi:MAG: septum site-determining protein MinC [Chloroflexi bacterium]|nr:MAG: septum site-determining protein MinC [Chloroflexota bacterium]
MNEQTIAIKGTRDGLLISLSETEEWSQMTDELAAHIDEKGEFFNGARVTVETGTRPVRKHELASLRALLERRGLSLWAVQSASSTTLDAASALDLKVSENVNAVRGEYADDDDIPISSEEDGTAGLLIRRTLRSGRTVHTQGHVVVYGDVNPGSEIVATGDIIVWGRLRGNVHAGADGDENAVVCALDMMPTQLRIAGYIVTSPAEASNDPQPEVALIRDGQIVVTAWR